MSDDESYSSAALAGRPHWVSQDDEATGGESDRYHNQLECRTGSLWEGRYKSSVVHREDYFLACCRYIELNPVRALMVAAPGEYRWSSFRERMGQETDGLLDAEPTYLSLGAVESERRSRWAVYLQDAIPPGEWSFIRVAVARGQLTGGQRFVDEVAAVVGRRIEHRGRGRPPKLARLS